MKVALVLENSNLKNSELIYKSLKEVCDSFGATLYNYGVYQDKDIDINYVEAGLLNAILLNSGAVDFVVSGCKTGEGVAISSNSFRGVKCGYIKSLVDMELFLRINNGNAISIPYEMLGIGKNIILKEIFTKLFTCKDKAYPNENYDKQEYQRNELDELKKASTKDFINVLNDIDKDMLYKCVKNEYFEENFFLNSKNSEISSFLKDFIDNV